MGIVNRTILFVVPSEAYLLYTNATLLQNSSFLWFVPVMGFVLALIHDSPKRFSSTVHLARNLSSSYVVLFLVVWGWGVDEAVGGGIDALYNLGFGVHFENVMGHFYGGG